MNKLLINFLFGRFLVGSLGALLLSCALAVMVAFIPVSPAMAQSAISWDDLQTHSTQTTNPDIADRAVQLSGYVLPLNENNRTQPAQQVSEFLLVPYVGACIHVPSPPPNQIIYIKPETAMENPGSFSPMLVTGTL